MREHMNQDDTETYDYKDRVVPPMDDRQFRFGEGKISAALSLALGVLSLLTVLCFMFPDFFTTPELRASYNIPLFRKILQYGMIAALLFSCLTFMLGKYRRWAALGALFTIAALALGGHETQAAPVESIGVSFGIDWLVLAFLVSAILFIFLEKVFPKYKDQAILRPGWELDTVYFTVNHLMISVLLFVGNFVVAIHFGWAVNAQFQAWIQSLPLVVQVVILLLCADFVLYWSHRTFHEDERLWKIHAIHHSVEHLDWMAGSRNHMIQMFIDRCLAMAPLYLLGASKEALDIYVAFAAFQAVYVHANVNIPVGPLKYILCTPQFHHWHHSSEKPAIDTNYAVHTPLYDMIFGTYHMPGKKWPAHYGTVVPIPQSFWGQFFYPFRK